jgi:hypothetical protein
VDCRKPPGTCPNPFTRRKKELFGFDGTEAGMTVYVRALYENRKGETGGRGPIVARIAQFFQTKAGDTRALLYTYNDALGACP